MGKGPLRPLAAGKRSHTVTMSRLSSGLDRFAVPVAWALAGAAVVAAAFSAWLVATVPAGWPTGTLTWKQILMPVIWAVPGAMIAAGRPRVAVGWLLLAVAGVFSGTALSEAWLRLATTGRVDTGVGWAVWFVDRFSAVVVVLTWLAMLLLPDGRLPSPRWRPVVAITGGAQVLLIAGWCLVAGAAAAPDSSYTGAVSRAPNPVGLLPAGIGPTLDDLGAVVLQAPLLMVPVAVAVRLRAAHSDERRRLAEVLLGAAFLGIVLVANHTVWPPAADVLDVVAITAFAVVLVAAVLRRRLPGVDAVLHHGLAYGTVTLAIAGSYVAVTGAAATRVPRFPPLAAGVVVAGITLALLPLRNRLQAWVDRLLYGDRRRPHDALRRLADRTHGQPSVEAVLAELAATVAISSKARWGSARAEGRVGTWGGAPGAGERLHAALVIGDAPVGEVQVALPPGRSARPADRRLLAELARHGGIAVQAAVLAEKIASDHERLLEAREEERRRLGRDLHDGLGPTIAGLAMQLGAVGSLVRHDPDAAGQRIALLQAATEEALADLRRIARELRPPSLDHIGLVGSLEQVASAMDVELEVEPGDVPSLPATVEVALYRIGAEAITNVHRHAGSRSAQLSLHASGSTVVLTVKDAGPGRALADSPSGVGTWSMRERAEELGGRVDVRSEPGRGTTVTAELPLTALGAKVMS